MWSVELQPERPHRPILPLYYTPSTHILSRHLDFSVYLWVNGFVNVNVSCKYCDRKFKRSKGRYNEALKQGWDQYCSPKCLSAARVQSKKCICDNPLCRKAFLRQQKEFTKSKLHFCGLSCRASYHNALRHNFTKLKRCQNEGCKNFVIKDKRSNYCSRECVDVSRRGRTKYSSEIVVDEIRKFFKINNRIPTRNELGFLNRLARRFFGTWNKAIIAAGFNPNPVRFANHFVAKDGHPCDSLSEKIVDDWLSTHKIPHEVKVKYPWNNGMSADFKIGEYYVEFFGLVGQLKNYDRLMKIKLQKIKEYNLKLISIYLSDIFPKNKLESKLVIANITRRS